MSARKPYRMRRFGIINHMGEVWSPDTFNTEAEARAYLADHQRRFPKINVKYHSVGPVNVTVSRIMPLPAPSPSGKEG